MPINCHMNTAYDVILGFWQWSWWRTYSAICSALWPKPTQVLFSSLPPTRMAYPTELHDKADVASESFAKYNPSSNPGELTFEEGTGTPWLFWRNLLTRFCDRRCWRDGTSSRSIQLYNVDARFIRPSASIPVLMFFSSIGRIIGTGIFSTPSSILSSVHSVGASLMLWVLGFVLSFCGLFVWLEFGTMYPRSGGEKVYLEAVYKKPKFLATVIFAMNAILLGFTASGCIVGFFFGLNSYPLQWVNLTLFVGLCQQVRISYGSMLLLRSLSTLPQYSSCSKSDCGSLGLTRNCHSRYAS